jgi:hypothetical protein
MKQTIRCLMALCMALLFAGIAFAQEGLVQTVVEGCKKELGTYC